eukprot:TCONS_00059161-protein
MIKTGLFWLLTATFATAFYDEKQFADLRKQYGWVDIPEVNMKIDEMIRYHGYPVEMHNVITEDHYVLSVQRIPSSPNYKGPIKSVPVFLQHGLLDSATTWVINGPKKSLAYVLADQGYDVWLGNSRGNFYSMTNTKIPNTDSKFWDFTFEEMAKYDVPACINYIQRMSNASKINYVGHSQGTTMAFIEFSRNQDLAKKINKMVALAPVATVNNILGAFKYFAKAKTPLKYLFKLMGVKQFLPTSFLTKYLAKMICAKEYLNNICAGFIFIMAGFDTSNMNTTRLPAYIAHTPAGASVKDMFHFAQNVGKPGLRKYDYGYFSNYFKYGQFSAPEYDFKPFNVRLAIFTGGNDWLAQPQDVSQSVRGQIKSIVYDEDFPEMNHLDFVWGVDAATLIYNKIVKIFDY